MNDSDLLDRINSIKTKIEKFIERGYIVEADNLLEQLYKKMPGDPEICSMRAVTRIIGGKLDEAECILQDGLHRCGDNFDLLYNLAYVNEQKGNYKKADRLYFMARNFSNEKQRTSPHHLRILHGTMEISNQMYTLSRGLRNLGVQADTYNYYPNYLNYKSDFIYDVRAENDTEKRNRDIGKIVQGCIDNYDIFHFHFGTSLVPNNSDIPLLANSGKKIFMHHWGSDVRLFSKAVKLCKYVRVKVTDEDQLKRSMDDLSKYIDTCIVGDYELYEYVKDYYKEVRVIPVVIDLKELAPAEDQNNEKPLVVHAPTSQYIKGTEYILKAVEELKDKYDFEFRLVSNMSNDDAKAIYRKADIIIDQLLIGGYGAFAIESMALAKPVIGNISDFMMDKYPNDLPVVSANPDNIKEKLEILLCDKQLRKDLGLKSRMYVEKYHDMNTVCKQLLELYEN